ncbi:MAG: Ig-like domain-containing protein [Sandaracinaceae bacterium]
MTRQSTSSILAMVLLAACAGEPGVDIRLVADPNISPEAQVLAAVDSIQLQIDSPDGPLYPPGAEATLGDVQIRDTDGQPGLEVVASIHVPSDHLPLVRIEQGGMPEVLLSLRFTGNAAEAGVNRVASGAVQGIRLGSPIEELTVPFNLVPERLPPRVSEVLPGPEATVPGCRLGSVFLMFSKPIDATSLETGAHITPGTLREVRLDGSGRAVELVLDDAVGDGTTLRYRLSLDPSVVDADGHAIDQVPSEPGDQPFAIDLELPCVPPPMTPEMPCEEVPPPAIGTCPFPARLACVDMRCVPRLCDGAACDDNEVCDPSTGYCEPDCRPWGADAACTDAAPSCEADTGLCR